MSIRFVRTRIFFNESKWKRQVILDIAGIVTASAGLIIAVTGLRGGLAAAGLIGRNGPTPSVVSPPTGEVGATRSSVVKFDFESGLQSWRRERDSGARAITRVDQTSEILRTGQRSLALQVELLDEGPRKCEGQEPGEGKCWGIA